MSQVDEKPQSDKQDQETDFATLFENSMQSIAEGELVKGAVVQITNDWVVVDIGQKSEGQIDRREFLDSKGNLEVNVGDNVTLLLEQWEDDYGHIVLSKSKAEQMKVWDDVLDSHDNETLIYGTIIKRVKGGFHVNIKGLTAFLPNSQVDLRPVKDADALVGQSNDYRVIQYNKRKNNVIISRRAILEKERASMQKETLSKLTEGEIVEGYVKNITDYGAFIDLGSIDGLIHLTDLAWGKINHPNQIVSIGDLVHVKILKYNKEDNKIFLGLKQTTDDPWTGIEEKLPVGTKITGSVVNLTDYGAFVEIESGLEGLIHISEMSWLKLRHPSQKLKVGDSVDAQILDIDPANRRISMGMKQIEANPWDTLETKYPAGTKVTGVVKNITDFGVFIGINDEIDGLIHISDLSWNKIRHPSEVFSKGDEVEAVVLNVDKVSQRFSLSAKLLESNPWQDITERYKPGMLTNGHITNLADFGAFVELEDSLEGLVHISELTRGGDDANTFKIGTRVEVEVLNVDQGSKKIGLSIRKVLSDDSNKSDLTEPSKSSQIEDPVTAE